MAHLNVAEIGSD